MKRLLLDTNIYGFIVIDNKREKIHQTIHSNTNIDLYGFEVVRKELRATKRVIVNMNLRMDLLRVYDDLVKKTYEITDSMKKLADEYYLSYNKFGGTHPRSKLINDFLIIACASLKDLDIVVSNDVRTMLNEIAINAYKKVNEVKGINLPHFINYEEFKNVIKK